MVSYKVRNCASCYCGSLLFCSIATDGLIFCLQQVLKPCFFLVFTMWSHAAFKIKCDNDWYFFTFVQVMRFLEASNVIVNILLWQHHLLILTSPTSRTRFLNCPTLSSASFQYGHQWTYFVSSRPYPGHLVNTTQNQI